MLLSHLEHLGHAGKGKGKRENVVGTREVAQAAHYMEGTCCSERERRWQMLLYRERRLTWWEKVSDRVCELELNRDRDVKEDGSRLAKQHMWHMNMVPASRFWAPTLWQALAAAEPSMGSGHIRETSRRPAEYKYLRLLGRKFGNTGTSKLERALNPLLKSLKQCSSF